jgi:hypothetical protein
VLSLPTAGNKFFFTFLSTGCAFWLCTHKDVNPLHSVISWVSVHLPSHPGARAFNSLLLSPKKMKFLLVCSIEKPDAFSLCPYLDQIKETHPSRTESLFQNYSWARVTKHSLELSTSCDGTFLSLSSRSFSPESIVLV